MAIHLLSLVGRPPPPSLAERNDLVRVFRMVAMAGILAGCAAPATQRPIVPVGDYSEEILVQSRDEFARQARAQERVSRIFYRLADASSELCDKTGAGFGFGYIATSHLKSMSFEARVLTLDYLGYDPQKTVMPVTITRVIPGSAASKAGLLEGDRVLAVDGTPLHQLKAKVFPLARRDEPKEFAEVLDQYSKVSKDHQGRAVYRDSIVIRVSREGKPHSLTLRPDVVCDYEVFLSMDATTVNAYTDGRRIVTTEGMVNFAQTDNELALVLAHEMAHCSEGHIGKKRANAILAGLAGSLVDATFGTGRAAATAASAAGAAAFSQEFELESDYVGLYIMARAGFDTANASDFWRRMAKGNPLESNIFATTHPTTAMRHVLLGKTHEEIEAKRASGKRLVPNREAPPPRKAPRGGF